MASKVGSFLVFGLGTALAAGVLGTFIHRELGLSPSVIRLAALLCAGLLVIGLYSDRLGGRN